MSGISAQQVLRRAEGMVVARTKETEPQVEVLKNGVVMKQFPGDCLGTAAIFVFMRIWAYYRHTKEVLFDYTLQPAFTFVQGFNIDVALAGFQRVVFETQVLPRMREGEEAYKSLADKYDAAARVPGTEGKYLLYDVLVRIFVYIRMHGLNLNFINWSRLHPMPIQEAIKNLVAYDSYILESEASPFLGVLKATFPMGLLEEHEGQWIFVKDKTTDVLSVIGGKAFEVTVDASWFDGICQEKPEVQLSGPSTTNTRVVHDDLIKELADRIADLFSVSVQKMTPEQLEYIHGPSRTGLVGPRGVGRNALRGLAQIIGNGPLEDLVSRGITYVRSKNPAISVADAGAVVVSRVAIMQSAKRIVVENGHFHLVDR